jgi:vesicle-associated membrane protein 4
MKDTLNSALDRGVHVDTLQDKTQNLSNSAQAFNTRAHRVRKQMWWKDMKMRICIVVGIIILLIVIIVPSGMLAHQDPYKFMSDKVLVVASKHT